MRMLQVQKLQAEQSDSPQFPLADVFLRMLILPWLPQIKFNFTMASAVVQPTGDHFNCLLPDAPGLDCYISTIHIIHLKVLAQAET